MAAKYFEHTLANQSVIFTRRRSFAEYWKYFVARFNDVHAFGYTPPEVNGFG